MNGIGLGRALRKQVSKLDLFLVGILLIHIAINAMWLVLDDAGLVSDSLNYYTQSLETYRIALTGTLPEFGRHILHSGSWHPGLFALLPVPFHLLWGPHEDLAVLLVNSLFLGILFVSTYLLARRFGLGVWWARLCVLLLSLFPLVYGSSRQFMLDLPGTAMVALSALLLCKTDWFLSWRWSIWLGIACGVGCSIKETFPIMFLPVLLIAAFVTFRSKGPRVQRKMGRNALIVLGTAVAVALPFYGWSLDSRMQLHRELIDKGAGVTGYLQLFTWDSIGFYWRSWNNTISPLYRVVAVVSVVWGVFHSPTRPVAIWVVCVYLLMSCNPAKNSRYIFGILPAFALLMADLVRIISRRGGRLLACGLAGILIGYGVFQFTFLSFGRLPIADQETFLPWKESVPWSNYAEHRYLWWMSRQSIFDQPRRPLPASWKGIEIQEVLARHVPEKGGVSLRVFVLKTHPFLDGPLQRWALERGFDVEVLSGSFTDASTMLSAQIVIEMPKWLRDERDVWRQVHEVKAGSFIGYGFVMNRIDRERAAREFFEKRKSACELIRAVSVPRADLVRVWSCNFSERHLTAPSDSNDFLGGRTFNQLPKLKNPIGFIESEEADEKIPDDSGAGRSCGSGTLRRSEESRPERRLGP
ncbi:MAG: glycosyltransferase family 39 protein [Pseudomonadota bacterium]